ncbi:MAG TPA: uroporphyrinogen-III synthase [Pantanalinema sp.]
MVRPLEGRRVLVTRPREQAAELVSGLEALGAEVRVMPTIAISPPGDRAPLDAALDTLDAYAWAAFTSVNAVEAFFARLRERGARMPSTLRVAAVGDRTAEALASQGHPAHLVPKVATAVGLAEALRAEEDLHDKRFIFPRGDRASQTLATLLREAGARVEDPVAYRTVPGMDAEEAGRLKEALRHGGIDWIALTSPSTWIELLEAIAPERVPSTVRLAAIGPSTARAIRQSGYEVGCEAREPGLAGLLEAIARAN